MYICHTYMLGLALISLYWYHQMKGVRPFLQRHRPDYSSVHYHWQLPILDGKYYPLSLINAPAISLINAPLDLIFTCSYMVYIITQAPPTIVHYHFLFKYKKSFVTCLLDSVRGVVCVRTLTWYIWEFYPNSLIISAD